MKKITICTFIIALNAALSTYSLAQVPFSNLTTEEVKELGLSDSDLSKYNLNKRKDYGFSENNGQLKDINGQELNNVFYYCTELNRKILITNHGITLFLFKTGNSPKDEEEFNLEKNKVHSNVNWNRIDIAVENGNILNGNIEFYEPLPHLTNYFISGTHTNIKSYSKLVIKNVLPGIDWVIYNNSQKGFKYDFIVHPGANPSDLKLNYNSQNAGKINTDGSFSIFSESGGIIEAKPYSYLKNDNLTKINSSFKLDQISETTNDKGLFFNTKISFELANYDQTETLVIDPSVSWSTDIPSNDEEYAYGMTTDESNNVYIVGRTYSTNLPTLDFGGGAYYDGTLTVRSDAFIMKFNNSGTKQWATYYGGNYDEAFTDITCNNSGRLAVVGLTSSSDPTCVAWGSAYYDNIVGGSAGSTNAGLILMFNYSGQLFWATTFGAGSTVMLNSAKFDSNNKLYVVGHSGHHGYPTVNLAGASNDDTPNHVFGGMASDIFIARFSSTGVQEWGRWYGGSNAGTERPQTIEIDDSNNLYIGGFTEANNLPCVSLAGAFPNDNTNAGLADGFLLKFNSNCVLVWATYIGGTGRDEINTIKINGTQKYVAGIYGSSNFSTYTPFPSQPVGAFVNLTLSGSKDAFLIKLNANDDIEWSTLIGGTGDEVIELSFFQGSHVAINSCGNVFIAFPTTSSAGLPMKVCDGGYSSTSYTAGSFPNYFICSFKSSGEQLWGTYYGAGSFANENPVTLAISPNDNLFFLAERTQWPDINLTKFIKTPLSTTISGSGASSCSCQASVTPSSTCGTLTYLWSNGQTAATATNLCNGPYSVAITDAIMCRTTNISLSISSCAIILPIELTNFNVSINKKNTIDLTWETLSERDNDFFTIDKSIDGENWTFLDNIEGSGTTSNSTRYYLEDINPQRGINYYRLKQTDLNGQITEVENDFIYFFNDELILSPNPTSSQTFLDGKSVSEYTIAGFNNLGQKIELSQNILNKDKLELNTENIPAGVYYLSLDHLNSSKILKLIIEK